MTRTALITGGAQGIGRGIADRLVENDWKVAIFDKDAEAVDEVSDTLPGSLALPVDVADEASVHQGFATLADWLAGSYRLCQKNAKPVLRVGPVMAATQAAGGEQGAELIHAVFVRVLRHYAFSGAKVATGVTGQTNTVTLAGNQVHLDTPMGFIKVGLVAKKLGLEFGIQLAIDDIEDVQVERCGDAAGIVISCLQDGAWLEQVGANQQTPVLAAMCAYASEKAHGVAGLEVAD